MIATQAKAEVAVVGLGNVLMRDDGFGVHLVEALQREDSIPGVELWDFGTSAMDMLGVFLDHEKVIVVDSVRAGHAPGTIYRFTAEALGAESNGRMSSHDTRLLDVIGMARMLGASPEVVIYGAEPEEIAPALGLSDSAQAVLGRVAHLVADEARMGCRPGIQCPEIQTLNVLTPEGWQGVSEGV